LDYWKKEPWFAQAPAYTLPALINDDIPLSWYASRALYAMRRAARHYATASYGVEVVEAVKSWEGYPVDLAPVCALLACPDPLAILACRLLRLVEG